MRCCICRSVEVAKRETQSNRYTLRSTNLRKYFTFPEELQSQYQIEEIICEGGNTTAYKAKRKSTDEIVAIKVVIFPAPKHRTLDDQFAYIKENNLEINILKNIDNDNCLH